MVNHKNTRIRDICRVGICTALIVLMAQLRVPMPYGVPITMQTFAVALAGVVLGAKKGAASAAIYVLLGLAGAPVFSGFAGGIGMIWGPTGGFIATFPLLAFCAGYGALGILAGVLMNYMAGTLVFSMVTGTGFAAAFAACVLPFIPADVCKMLAAFMLGQKIKARLRHTPA